jgi:hypothetical protein
MPVKHLYIAVAVLVAAIVGGMTLHAYVAARLDQTRADQVRRDMQPVHEQAQQQRQETTKAEDSNQKALLATLAAIAAQKQQPVSTPVDYARIEEMIEARMGAKATVKTDAEHPDAPSATLPAKSLNQYMLACDEKTALLGSCQQTSVNTQKLLDTEKADHAATKKELDAARVAIKGGGFITRLRRNAKWFVIGGAVGATAAVAARR